MSVTHLRAFIYGQLETAQQGFLFEHNDHKKTKLKLQLLSMYCFFERVFCVHVVGRRTRFYISFNLGMTCDPSSSGRGKGTCSYCKPTLFKLKEMDSLMDCQINIMVHWRTVNLIYMVSRWYDSTWLSSAAVSSKQYTLKTCLRFLLVSPIHKGMRRFPRKVVQLLPSSLSRHTPSHTVSGAALVSRPSMKSENTAGYKAHTV